MTLKKVWKFDPLSRFFRKIINVFKKIMIQKIFANSKKFHDSIKITNSKNVHEFGKNVQDFENLVYSFKMFII